MKKSYILGGTVLSVALIVALSGCGGDSVTEQKEIKADIVSPLVSQAIPPYEMPSIFEEGEVAELGLKSNRSLGVTMGADKSTYQVHGIASVSLTNMPQKLDWIGLFHEGDDITVANLLSYSWVGGDTTVDLKISNSVNPSNYDGVDLTSAEYVIVAFTQGKDMTQVGATTINIEVPEQNNFNPTVSISNQTNYSGDMIPISVDGLAAFDGEFVGIFPAGSSNDWGNALEWEWTDDIRSGEISALHGVSAGDYQIRVFYDGDMELETFTNVTVKANININTSISTDNNTYEDNERITVSFDGMPGNEADIIGIYKVGAGSSVHSAETLEWTNGREKGSVSLDPVEAGQYEIRAYHQGADDTSVSVKSITITAAAPAQRDCKVALFADEHDPLNRLLAVDYGTMTAIDQVPVDGSLTHHADVVSADFLPNGGLRTANHILMIPKGSQHINVYTVKDRTFVKRINLPFKPRSADAFNKNKNLILLTSSQRPAAVLIDAKNWNIVGEAGMNISCQLKFNTQNYFPWYYKNVVYKNDNLSSGSVSCIAPDFGGQQISGHPTWLDDNHFAILDRANRMIHIYKLSGQNANGKWDIKLSGSVRTSTSLHQMIKDPDSPNIFYGMTEGNGNGTNGLNTTGIAPDIYKWEFKNGSLTQLNKTSLITTQTINTLKTVGAYKTYTKYVQKYVAAKSYYNYYYPTYYNSKYKTYKTYYPTNYSNYYNKYYNNYKGYYKTVAQTYTQYYTKQVPVTIQQQFNSLGGHNLYMSPTVNGTPYLWGAVASGQAFVVDADNMNIATVVNAGTGAGHVNFQQNGDYAVITNHKSRSVTIADYNKMIKVKDVNLTYNNENIFSTLQSHSPYITEDDRYFHNTWTDGGVFFRIDLDDLELENDDVYTGGIPIQGNYYTNYKCPPIN